MRMRTLLMVCVGLLLIPGAAWSMQESSPAGAPTPAPAASPATPSNNVWTTQVFAPQYYPATQLADIIQTVMGEPGVRLAVDDVLNRLIITAPQERLEEIGALIAALDVTKGSALRVRQMMCRIYMLELPSEDRSLRPFSIELEGPSQVPAAQLLEAVKEGDLRIGSVVQSDQESESGKWVLLIDGRASSNESVKRLVERIPEAQIKQLKWDAEAFTIPAAQVAQLPEQLQQHLRRFLGEGVQTAAYWFGSLSIPGKVEAPIGPWVFQLEVDESLQGGELELSTTVVRQSQVGFIPPMQILSNSIRARIGKPVIIGYNRDSYGVRTMGAMVIIPEGED